MTTRSDVCSGEMAQEQSVVGATFRARQLTNVCAEINTMHTSMVPELLLVRTLTPESLTIPADCGGAFFFPTAVGRLNPGGGLLITGVVWALFSRSHDLLDNPERSP